MFPADFVGRKKPRGTLGPVRKLPLVYGQSTPGHGKENSKKDLEKT
jgi:hypothetical protein